MSGCMVLGIGENVLFGCGTHLGDTNIFILLDINKWTCLLGKNGIRFSPG